MKVVLNDDKCLNSLFVVMEYYLVILIHLDGVFFEVESKKDQDFQVIELMDD